MATSPVVLILGSGSNVGHHTARVFAEKGYKVALASRSLKEQESTADQLKIAADFSEPESIVQVFEKVKLSLGVPSVVVYNAAAATKGEPKNPFSISSSAYARDLNINAVSVYVAAQQAVLGFGELPESGSKTFIYTGNVMNTMIIPALLTLGVGKSATAHLIETAASAYAGRGFKFYYADERRADGGPVYSEIDGKAHAELYIQLAEEQSQGPWDHTFVKGVGYKRF